MLPNLALAVQHLGIIAVKKADVAIVLAAAERAGARILKPAADVFWGGHHGYFADPDGHIWEVAHNPFSTPARKRRCVSLERWIRIMRKPASMWSLETLGRVRLSKYFYMREFLYSEIGNFHQHPQIFPRILILRLNGDGILHATA